MGYCEMLIGTSILAARNLLGLLLCYSHASKEFNSQFYAPQPVREVNDTVFQNVVGSYSAKTMPANVQFINWFSRMLSPLSG
jgi:hypothetical protein